MAVNSAPAIGARIGSIENLPPASQVSFSPANPEEPNQVQVYLPWTQLASHTVTSGVAVADLLTMRVVQDVPLSDEPTDIVVGPDGQYVYTIDSDNVSVIETDTLESTAVPVLVPKGTIAASPATTFTMGLLTGAAITADGSQLLVAGQQQPPDVEDNAFLAAIDTGTNTVQHALTSTSTTDFFPHHVALTPDGRYAITNLQLQRIDFIDLVQFTIVKSVMFNPDSVIAMVVDPTSTYVFVAAGLVNGTTGSIHVVDIASATVVGTFPLASAPQQIDISPDGQNLFVTVGPPNYPERPVISPTLVTLDAREGTPTTLLSSAGPFAIDPVGQRIFVFDAVAKILNIFALAL